MLDHAFGPLALHRLEANIQPGNAASIALARGAGFRLEGFSPRYLLIGGQWRDHERYAITVDERTPLRRARAEPTELRLALGVGLRLPLPPPRRAPARHDDRLRLRRLGLLAAGRAPAAPAAARSRRAACRASTACRARRPGGRSGTAARARGPITRISSRPCSRVMPVGVAAQQLRREVAERADHLRLDQLELAEQVVLAVVDLLRQRVAVAGRPALEDVGDEDVARASRPISPSSWSSSLPAWPTNGRPCLSSLAPGRLADEHQVGVGVARAEDDGLAGRGELRAARADRRLPADGLELLAALLRAGHGPR